MGVCCVRLPLPRCRRTVADARTTPTCERRGMVARDRAPEDEACASTILVTAGGKPRELPFALLAERWMVVALVGATAARDGDERGGGGERAGEHTALLWPRCRPRGRRHGRVRRPAWTLVGSSRFLRLYSAAIYCGDPCLLDGRRWFRLYDLARCCVHVLLVASSLFYSSRFADLPSVYLPILLSLCTIMLAILLVVSVCTIMLS
nr:uncharacterized protein LOC109762134 isoform X2 [Aegilops tauschii subsp. strangulata]